MSSQTRRYLVAFLLLMSVLSLVPFGLPDARATTGPNLAVVKTLNVDTWDPGNSPYHSAVIDTAAGYAYFAAGQPTWNFVPPSILKVRLSDLTVVANLNLTMMNDTDVGDTFYEAAPGSSVIDTAHGFMYVGMISQYVSTPVPSVLLKISLSSFTLVGRYSLPSDTVYELLGAGVIDPSAGFAYWGLSRRFLTNALNAYVIKVDLSSFTQVNLLDLTGATYDANSAMIDTAHHFAYFGDDGMGVVSQVNLSSFTLANQISIPSDSGELQDMTLDPVAGYGYFFLNDYTPDYDQYIWKVHLSDMSVVGNVTFPSYQASDHFNSAVADVAHGYVFFPGSDLSNSSFQIAAVRLSDFTVTVFVVPNTGGTSGSAVIDTVNKRIYGSWFITNDVVEFSYSGVGGSTSTSTSRSKSGGGGFPPITSTTQSRSVVTSMSTSHTVASVTRTVESTGVRSALVVIPAPSSLSLWLSWLLRNWPLTLMLLLIVLILAAYAIAEHGGKKKRRRG